MHAWDDGVALDIYARRLIDRYASCAVRHKLPRHITASTRPWQARAAATAAVVAAAADAVGAVCQYHLRKPNDNI